MANIISDAHLHICKTPLPDMLSRLRAHERILWAGFSEHVYQLREIRAAMGEFFLEGEIYGAQEYIELVRGAQGEGLRLLCGVEMDYIPELMPAILRETGHYDWDYIIGSVHELDRWDIHDRAHRPDMDIGGLWYKYFDTQCELLERCEIQILAHPLRLLATEKRTPADMRARLDELVGLAKAKNTAVEINAKDIRLSPRTAELLIDACAESGAMVSLGSDAHVPEEISRGISILSESPGLDSTRQVVFEKKTPVYL